MGGILGTRKIADMIDAHYGQIIPHAAQGPICTVACLHIDASTPNAWLQETFEDYNESWERDLISGFPAITGGHFELPQAFGLGIELNEDEVRRHPYHERPDISLYEENWHFRRSARAKTS
jgi:galactonate dehydratase